MEENHLYAMPWNLYTTPWKLPSPPFPTLILQQNYTHSELANALNSALSYQQDSFQQAWQSYTLLSNVSNKSLNYSQSQPGTHFWKLIRRRSLDHPHEYNQQNNHNKRPRWWNRPRWSGHVSHSLQMSSHQHGPTDHKTSVKPYYPITTIVSRPTMPLWSPPRGKTDKPQPIGYLPIHFKFGRKVIQNWPHRQSTTIYQTYTTPPQCMTPLTNKSHHISLTEVCSYRIYFKLI